MGQVPLLSELAIIAAIAVAVTVLLHRFKLPTVAGLLAAGALMGPYGFGLIHRVHSIETLAEIGVVLLLFTIGLEFSLARLRHIFRSVALGGALQVTLTIAVVAAVARLAGAPTAKSVFYGFVFALSSTAIVLRALSDRRELDAPQGRFIVGTLIFQDLCVVPMVLTVPLLAKSGSGEVSIMAVALAMGQAGLLVATILTLARFVVPTVLGYVDASRSREVFLLAILAICIGTAWITNLFGLSLALGAFLGGMVVADTEYGRRALGDMLPLRDVFVSIFFVSLGMLFEPRTVIAQPALVGVFLFGFFALKAMLATLAALVMRFPPRVAWLAGVGLAQFGEFGFVLTDLGQNLKLVDRAEVAPLLAAGILSMFLTPLVVRIAPHVTAGERLLLPLSRLLGARSINEDDRNSAELSGHVVIVGYGLAGRFAATALERAGIPFVALELNAETVLKARERGEPVYYADATSEEALGHAHLSKARALVLLINDASAAERVIVTAQRVAKDVPLLVRSRYLTEREPLIAIGARDVVAEEVEGAVEVLSRLLRWLETPRNLIEESIRTVRSDTQTTERKLTLPRSHLADYRGLDELKIESVSIPEGSVGHGSSLMALELRSKTGALVVAVRRDAQLLNKPDPSLPFLPDDIVYLVGTSTAIRRAVELLVMPREAEAASNPA
ncbi:MAG: cation:proton antiporter [Polyangiaceae bacterium]